MTEPDWSKFTNFSRSEFECKCGCKRADMDPSFMNILQTIRNGVGSMTITSGFRCENHPTEKRKSRPGAHSIGKAADIAFTDAGQLHAILNKATTYGIQGIGVGKTFIHLDVGHPYAHRPAGWGYGS